MAQAITVSPTLRVGPKIEQVGMIPFSLALTTEAYATPTGITVDFVTLLAANSVAFKDVARVVGRAASGHLAIFTKTTTAAQFTMRLWNGATEIVDGNKTDTVTGEIFFAPGTPNE